MNHNHRPIRILFVVAAAWDGILGLVFLFMAPAVFRWFSVTPPNHFGYVHFPAALLITFGVMFAAVAASPVRNRNLIPFGMLLKLSYCSVVAYHWSRGSMPDMWKPFAIIDLAFLVLFVIAFRRLRTAATTPAPPGEPASRPA